MQRLATTAFQPPGHHALHYLGPPVPVQPEVPGSLLPTQLSGQFGHGTGQVCGDAHSSPRPEDGLSSHPTAPTADPPRVIVQDHGKSPERETLPVRRCLD